MFIIWSKRCVLTHLLLMIMMMMISSLVLFVWDGVVLRLQRMFALFSRNSTISIGNAQYTSAGSHTAHTLSLLIFFSSASSILLTFVVFFSRNKNIFIIISVQKGSIDDELLAMRTNSCSCIVCKDKRILGFFRNIYFCVIAFVCVCVCL